MLRVLLVASTLPMVTSEEERCPKSCHKPSVHVDCARIWPTKDKAGLRLCNGVNTLLQAPCLQLREKPFLANVIRNVGVAPRESKSPHANGAPVVNDNYQMCRLFGSECANTVRTPQAGLFQEPRQLASTLVDLSDLCISSYLELGIYTAWSAHSSAWASLRSIADGRVSVIMRALRIL